jgi:ketosteroid isomerase-like protein
MSQENVDVVRSFIEASGDVNVIMAALDPEIEWTPVQSDPEYQVHHGHADVRAWLASWSDAFPDLRWEPDRVLDAGGETVVALVSLLGRGEASGLDVGTAAYGVVFTVRAGKIVLIHEYPSSREALEAAGLSE